MRTSNLYHLSWARHLKGRCYTALVGGASPRCTVGGGAANGSELAGGSPCPHPNPVAPLTEVPSTDGEQESTPWPPPRRCSPHPRTVASLTEAPLKDCGSPASILALLRITRCVAVLSRRTAPGRLPWSRRLAIVPPVGGTLQLWARLRGALTELASKLAFGSICICVCTYNRWSMAGAYTTTIIALIGAGAGEDARRLLATTGELATVGGAAAGAPCTALGTRSVRACACA
jgi:hypothetical protein